VHVAFSVGTSASNRKTQSFKFRQNIFCFVPDWDTTAFKSSFQSIPHAQCSAYRFQCWMSLQIAKRNLSNFDESSVISIRIEILRRLNALSNPFYTPNVVHVDFSIETVCVNRKTQSFKFRRKLSYFVPDWDTTAFKRSSHSILNAQCSASRFQRRNKRFKSQNAIFQISTKYILFRSGLRYYGVWTLFPLHSTRRK
jgi:hypothetical protein